MLASKASAKNTMSYLRAGLFYTAWVFLWTTASLFIRLFPKTSQKVMLRQGFPSGLPSPTFINATSEIASTAIEVIVAFILALIAALIGVNLIGPVATAVGGALNNKNLTGAANSLTAQITLIFVTVVIVGIVIFLALLGKKASSEA